MMDMNEANDTPAAKVGAVLQQRRKKLGLSTHEVAARAGFNQSFVVRIEQGLRPNPDPTKIAAIASVLGLDAAEVLTDADFPLLPDSLSPALYLRAKLRDLSPADLAALQREVAAVLEARGITANGGPAPGEDEAPHQPSTEPTRGGTP